MLHNCIARASQPQSAMAECGLIDDVTARAPLCHCHSYIRSFIRGSGWRHTSLAHRSALYPSTISTLEKQRRGGRTTEGLSGSFKKFLPKLICNLERRKGSTKGRFLSLYPCLHSVLPFQTLSLPSILTRRQITPRILSDSSLEALRRCPSPLTLVL